MAELFWSVSLVAREALETLLGIDAPQRLAAMVAVGVPSTAPAAGHDRKSVDDVLRFVG